jgi:hypothetical protein
MLGLYAYALVELAFWGPMPGLDMRPSCQGLDWSRIKLVSPPQKIKSSRWKWFVRICSILIGTASHKHWSNVILGHFLGLLLPGLSPGCCGMLFTA